MLAERTFLNEMGGGCQSPVAAYGEILGHQLRLRAVSFLGDKVRRVDLRKTPAEAASLGKEAAAKMRSE